MEFVQLLVVGVAHEVGCEAFDECGGDVHPVFDERAQRVDEQANGVRPGLVGEDALGRGVRVDEVPVAVDHECGVGLVGRQQPVEDAAERSEVVGGQLALWV